MAEGDNYGLLVLCAFIHADIACTYTSDSCTKRIPGGLRILITGSFSERREGSDPTHGVKEFTYIHMIDWSTWQPDGLLQVHLWCHICIIQVHIKLRFRNSGRGADPNAWLALGSCGTQELLGLSEWPASINEHGAINGAQSRGVS